jgi:hypothetical protein
MFGMNLTSGTLKTFPLTREVLISILRLGIGTIHVQLYGSFVDSIGSACDPRRSKCASEGEISQRRTVEDPAEADSWPATHAFAPSQQ